ncbi:uncharacterized protein LOC134209078 [Armigeres subalbatus]|uniref:uncharacterized protein LOC134209078 n=1 Tax=Armigeres subalbatus TaxID=124917 RepID=UPI002ED2B65A
MFPVHKKGNNRDINNYRGITSLNAVSKLFELVILEPLEAHCKPFLSNDQHSLTPGRSTATNLLCLTSYITDCMVQRAQTDVIYTDLAAAFDKVNHDIAIAKIKKFGINGIPQGSHLGPFLFLLYFNDVHRALKASRLSFADDLKIVAFSSNSLKCSLIGAGSTQ